MCSLGQDCGRRLIMPTLFRRVKDRRACRSEALHVGCPGSGTLKGESLR